MGVDVFFAISGYLISGIIFRQLAAGSFSFADFYARRIRRIFPALLVVFAAAFITGWIGMLAAEFKQLGKHMAAGAGFVENLILWREAGYFDTASELKPLMHLWSLAIEEQYYLLYPLLIVAIWRLGWNIWLTVAVLSVGSFFWNIHQVHVDPVATFFLPQTRIWELLAGGVLAWIHASDKSILPAPMTRVFTALKNSGISLDYIGINLVIFPMFIVNKQLAFPGWWALLPVIGTLLLIQAGDTAWTNRYLLSNRLMVGIGLISYPLYLWHWPVLSFARLLLPEAPSTAIFLLLILASLVLAIFTYFVIEKPIRSVCINRKIIVSLIVLMLTFGVVGYLIYHFNGVPSRDRQQARNDYDLYFEETRYMSEQNIYKLFRRECDFVGSNYKYVNDNIDPTCTTPETNSRVFLWGDSQIQHLYHGLKKALPKNISILQVATAACVPSLDLVSQETSFGGCNKSNEFALNAIKKTKPDVVIMATLFDRGRTDYDDVAKKLKSLGVKRVYLMGVVPVWEPHLNKVISSHYWNKPPERLNEYLDKKYIALEGVLKKRYENKENIEYISLFDFLCNEQGCLVRTGDDIRNDLITWDNHHFTKTGSEFVGKNLLAPKIMSEWK